MAAGRHGGFQDLKSRDGDDTISRKKIGCLRGDYDLITKGSRCRGRDSLEYRSEVRQNDIEERDEIAVLSMDLEPGELSSDVSDGAIDSEVKILEIGSRLSTLQDKKRKFSPIVWDRGDGAAIRTVKSRSTSETTTPPPPPSPESHDQGFLDADVKTSPADASEINNDDYVPERTILSSRWANDESEISGTEDKQKVKWKTGSELAALAGCRKSASPEPGEVVREGSESVDMLQGCRSVYEFENPEKIDEGTYGTVYMAKDNKTGETVALKKVKMDAEKEGFPVTSLREINILLSLHHPSIVDFKEVVVGSEIDNVYMVMEYMEHDLKAFMEMMIRPYSQSEVKCLMLQLLEGIKYLHDNWVLHRDLKTSNLLLNNRGELKICDFGLSRQYGRPLKPYTPLVVTLWYRSPELLLGAKEYSTAIDMWSLGCIMAELLTKKPLFNGDSEIDQLRKIYKILGTPNETIWPGLSKLPGVNANLGNHKYNLLREVFQAIALNRLPVTIPSDAGFDLLNKLLTYDPEKRITAEAALRHEWFREVPLPKSKEFMPTFPAENEQDRRRRREMKSRDPLEEQRRKELQRGKLGTGGLFGNF
ncbi:hypothetical protein MIMGU_mgv1a021441mg [Erythranthe guttata]|uniref:cyclin-dependent kinase n=1 Tax=Erythranthe guttata TaxID=4155 RepID=A0A022PXQ7_ERYGU|nr:hypothetical protein MIMGU_mgv1a021441mg [Erythranthe guttata]